MQWTLINHCHRINRAKLCSLSFFPTKMDRWKKKKKESRVLQEFSTTCLYAMYACAVMLLVEQVDVVMYIGSFFMKCRVYQTYTSLGISLEMQWWKGIDGASHVHYQVFSSSVSKNHWKIEADKPVGDRNPLKYHTIPKCRENIQ